MTFSARITIAGMCRLFRLPLALMNGAAALGGYLLCREVPPGASGLLLFIGVTLMACAASAFNQVIERDVDALMRRTMTRPLPAGELDARRGALIAVLVLLPGALVLAALGAPPVLIALATLAWYLAVYTPLKRRTPFALLAGAFCGALPPLIGWSAARGALSDFRIVLLCGILYLWQVPHFWMLQKRHADDYRLAGLPLFTPQSFRGPGPFLVLWLAAVVAATLMLPAFGLIAGSNASLWCLAFCLPLLLTPFRRLEAAAYVGINIFPALVTLALYSNP